MREARLVQRRQVLRVQVRILEYVLRGRRVSTLIILFCRIIELGSGATALLAGAARRGAVCVARLSHRKVLSGFARGDRARASPYLASQISERLLRLRLARARAAHAADAAFRVGLRGPIHGCLTPSPPCTR